jgi:pyroglutamyl-peptidase
MNKILKTFIIIFIFFTLFISSIPNSNSNIISPKNHEKNQIILITGFEPFGNHKINPSQLVVENLNGTIIDGVSITGIILPVNFTSSMEVLIKEIELISPDFVLCFGLDASSRSFQLEKIGLNLKRDPYEDKLFNINKIDQNGPLFRVSSLPTFTISKEIRKAGIFTRQSINPGIYVCNSVLYGVLGYISKNNLDIKAGFIHVPNLSTEDPKGMDLDTMLEASRITISICIDHNN